MGALKDSMVFPNQGEHWGSEPDGTYGTPLDMKDTKFYKENLFGLKDAKIDYLTTPGDHLQFTDAELYAWVDKYFLGKTADVVVREREFSCEFSRLSKSLAPNAITVEFPIAVLNHCR